MKAIHLNNALRPNDFAFPLCGAQHKPGMRYTTDPERVTCKRCKKILEGKK